MAQQLRALTALPEILGSVPNNHLWWDLMPSSGVSEERERERDTHSERHNERTNFGISLRLYSSSTPYIAGRHWAKLLHSELSNLHRDRDIYSCVVPAMSQHYNEYSIISAHCLFTALWGTRSAYTDFIVEKPKQWERRELVKSLLTGKRAKAPILQLQSPCS